MRAVVTTPDRPFSLRVAGLPHDLEVTRLLGREQLCGLYRFTLDLVTSRRLVAGGRALLGRAATLTLQASDGATRRVHGVVTRQEVEAHDESHELRVIRLRLEPRMALLRHRVRSRVFHDLTPAAVAGTVLREWGVTPEGRFTRLAARLEHCVQRGESDLAFVTRVLARHGLAWWFEHPQGDGGDVEADDTRTDLVGATVAGDGDLGDAGFGREKVVLCDAAEQYSALGGDGSPRVLRYVGHEAEGDDLAPGDVTRFVADDRLRPTAARVTRYDPARYRPEGGSHLSERVEVREANTTEAALGLEVGRFDAEHATAPETASARALLEAARRDAARCRGRCGLADVAPGRRFTLAEHACVELDGAYVVTSATHRGEAGQGSPSYTNDFACAPASTLVRPRVPRAPHGGGVESATVVGDVLDDVHTDGDGRVRVRFHWDARGASADECSCKVRVATPWSGDGYGTQFTPRAGREVLVAFLDGDVDQPVVVGALHNGSDSAPFPVGQDTRRSGIRTQTIGGEGHNELSFEDLAGREEVYVRAQRDLRQEVHHDRIAHMRGNDRTSVEGSVTEHVGGDVGVRVGGEVRVRIDAHNPAQDALEARAEGNVTLSVAKQLRLVGEQSIVLVCGEAQISMTPDMITLSVADTHINLTGTRIDLDAVKVYSTSTDRIDLQAPHINLNSRTEP